jgi:hypothetical protein
MAFTTAGFAAIAGLIISDGTTPFNAANCYLGVGDDTTAFDPSQTDLNPGVAGNELRQQVSGAPSRNGNAITFACSFTAGQANWTWNENGIFNASSGPTMLTRKVENLVTKTNAATATFTKTLTISQT